VLGTVPVIVLKVVGNWKKMGTMTVPMMLPLLVLLLVGLAHSLNNGVGLKPAMGFNVRASLLASLRLPRRHSD
jgi:hypothetical protein